MAEDELNDQLDYEFHSSESEEVEFADNEGSKIENEKNSAPQTAKSAATDAAAAEAKKLKQKAKQKERKRIKNEADRQQKQQLALLEPALIADYISKHVHAANPELSVIELQDKSVPESQIVFTGDKVPERTGLDDYAPFFSAFGLDKKEKGKKDLVLVLCMSAIRVCEVVRALRKTDCGGALKLIKQNKPEYDKRCLKSPCHVAVSTPGRIFKLKELRILDFKRIKRIVVDTSLLDAKQRTIWDIDGTIELVSELTHKNKAQVYLF